MSTPEYRLAINGGPKAVTASGKERWKHVRLRDGLPIMGYLLAGQSTSATGKGRVEQFEKSFAKRCGCAHGLSMSCGTAALHSALFAVGVGPGDEVIVPSYTWHASATAILCCGGKPVFCEVDPRTLTADPADIEGRITDKTRAMVIVHLWGNPARMDAIRKLADEHDIRIVEDCSHVHGGSYDGKPVGAWGDIGCFSLQGTKAVTAGEGGIAVCNDPLYFDRMLAFGQPVRVEKGQRAGTFDQGMMNIGPKYRAHLFGIQLAIASLKRLDELNRLRARNWKILEEELAGCSEVQPTTTLPTARRGGHYEFKLILSDPRPYGGIDRFIEAAKAEGVPLSQDRLMFLHEHAMFSHPGPITLKSLSSAEPSGVSLPVTESLRGRLITLPAFTKVSEAFVRQCGKALVKVARGLQAK